MSFTQLFHNLGRFVQDPNTRWDYCVRAKRGQSDTARPGQHAHIRGGERNTHGGEGPLPLGSCLRLHPWFTVVVVFGRSSLDQI